MNNQKQKTEQKHHLTHLFDKHVVKSATLYIGLTEQTTA